MKDELNPLETNNETISELYDYEEASAAPIFNQPTDLHNAPEHGADKLRSPKKKNPINLMTSFVATVTVAGTVAVTTLTGSDLKAKITNLAATDTAVVYRVELEELPEGESVTIVIFNDFIRYEQPLENTVGEGIFDGLKPGVKYTLAVKDGGETIAQKSVYTRFSEAKLDGLTYECKCAVDGYFYFDLDYVDKRGEWQDFSATLTDEYGNTAYCEFTDNPDERQQMDVAGANLRGETATLFVYCYSTEVMFEGKPLQIKLVEEQVKI